MFSAKPKTPRPTGKAGRYESSQRGCGPSDNSPKKVFRQSEALSTALFLMDLRPLSPIATFFEKTNLYA